MSGRLLSIDVREVDALARRLEALTPEAFGRQALSIVNTVAASFDRQARAGANAGLNLSDGYIQSKTDLILGTNPARPRAEIVTRGDLTILGHYPYRQLHKPARNTRRVAKGDPKRGIPAGQKQAGIEVAIRRGDPAAREKWFTMTLRRGSAAGDKVGVFVRASSKGGKPKHIYGPSPYSLAAHQYRVLAPEFESELQRSAIAGYMQELERAAQ